MVIERHYTGRRSRSFSSVFNLPLRTGVSYRVLLEDGTGHDIASPVINDVPGALAIQEVFKNAQWAMFSSDALAYIPHVRKEPLVARARSSARCVTIFSVICCRISGTVTGRIGQEEHRAKR